MARDADRDKPAWWPSSLLFDQNAFTAGAVLLGACGALSAGLVYRRYLKRFPTVDALPADVFKKRRWVKGHVTSVGDADNFRLYHTPGPFWSWPLKLRRVPASPKGQTLHIRLAGVDAPEGAHFGKPKQPYSDEALAWLRSTVEGKRVYCQLLSRDQYSRIVAIVLLPPRILPSFLFSGRNVSLEMLRNGWATTYAQAGAEYGERTKEQFQLVEAEAKATRRGMWEKGTDGETPAEYKRRYAKGVEEAEKAAPKTTTTPRTRRAKKQARWWWPF